MASTDMPVISIDDVQLAMPEEGEEDARLFCRDLLGIPEMPKPSRLAKRGGCWFENGPLKLHLGVEQPFAPARKAHPALIVSELTALATAIRKAGFPVVDNDPLEGFTRVYVEDPFGNRIELMEPIASR